MADKGKETIRTPPEGGGAPLLDDMVPVVGVGPEDNVASRSAIDDEKTKAVLEKVESATRTMEANVQAATERGQTLDDLQSKTECVAESSKKFQKSAKTVKTKLWWKNLKMTIIIVIVVLALGGLVAYGIFGTGGSSSK